MKPGWMVAMERLMPRHRRSIDDKVVVTSGELGRAISTVVECGPGISVDMLHELTVRRDVDEPLHTSTRKSKSGYGSVFGAAMANAVKTGRIHVIDGCAYPGRRRKAAA